MEFIEYPKCSTCKKARKFLENNRISFTDRNIKEDTPKVEEIKIWLEHNEIEVSKLFNTSGIKYRELNLKEKLNKLSLDEKIKLLATDGMLIKRPILVNDKKIVIGFKEKEWENFIRR